jgi:hypothetical protein
MVVMGKLRTSEEQRLVQECSQEKALDCRSAKDFVSSYKKLASEINDEASQSNLDTHRLQAISQAVSGLVKQIENWAA